MSMISGGGSPVARLRSIRPASVSALLRLAARQDVLADGFAEFKAALARERAGIRAELTAITVQLDACEARLDAFARQLDEGLALAEGRAESQEERVDLLQEALSGAGTLAHESRRRLMSVEEGLGLTSAAHEPCPDDRLPGQGP